MKKSDALPIAVLIIYPVIASIISLFFKVNTLWSLLLFLGIPCLYLAIRDSKNIKKCAIFSLFPTVLMIMADYFAQLNGKWSYQTSNTFEIVWCCSYL